LGDAVIEDEIIGSYGFSDLCFGEKLIEVKREKRGTGEGMEENLFRLCLIG